MLVHQFSSVQLLSLVRLFATPWTAACQASLSITNSWTLLKLMCIESVIAIQPSHPLLSPSPPAPNLSQYQDLFKWVSFSHEVASVLEFQLQHQSFQWIFRTLMLTKGNINFFYKSQSKSSEGYFIGHTYKPLVITFMLIFFFFANMTPPKAICSYFRFGVWRMLDPWPH